MSSLTLRKATRQKTKIRIGLSGPSGSGKTYSALLLASGMAPWDKIALIDTENGSGDLYSHLGGYSVLPLAAPFSPERYIQAIEECQKAGMEVIIIDSVSHEWDGKGGCLESNDLLGQTKFKGNNWAAWSVTTPRHQRFIESIVMAKCHIITTARSKTDTIQTEDKKIKKVGLKEIQREGFEFELTLNFTLDRDGHYATASKDRTGMFINADPLQISQETGAKILEWAALGIEPLPPPPPPPPSKIFVMEKLAECLTLIPLGQLYTQATKYTWDRAAMADINETYLTRYAKLSNWKRDGDKFFSDGGLMTARVERDDATGNVRIIENTGAAEADQAMADAERQGKAIESAMTETENTPTTNEPTTTIAPRTLKSVFPSPTANV